MLVCIKDIDDDDDDDDDNNNNNNGSRDSSAQLGKHLFDSFPSRNGLGQGDVLPSLLFNFVLDYSITRVQINQGDLVLNDTYPFSVILMVSMYGGSVNTLKEYAQSLVAAIKKVGQDANADENKYTIMSPEQNGGRSHNIKIDSSPFESVEEFKYLGNNSKYKSSIQEEIRSRLKSGNA